MTVPNIGRFFDPNETWKFEDLQNEASRRGMNEQEFAQYTMQHFGRHPVDIDPNEDLGSMAGEEIARQQQSALEAQGEGPLLKAAQGAEKPMSAPEKQALGEQRELEGAQRAADAGMMNPLDPEMANELKPDFMRGGLLTHEPQPLPSAAGPEVPGFGDIVEDLFTKSLPGAAASVSGLLFHSARGLSELRAAGQAHELDEGPLTGIPEMVGVDALREERLEALSSPIAKHVAADAIRQDAGVRGLEKTLLPVMRAAGASEEVIDHFYDTEIGPHKLPFYGPGGLAEQYRKASVGSLVPYRLSVEIEEIEKDLSSRGEDFADDFKTDLRDIVEGLATIIGRSVGYVDEDPEPLDGEGFTEMLSRKFDQQKDLVPGVSRMALAAVIHMTAHPDEWLEKRPVSALLQIMPTIRALRSAATAGSPAVRKVFNAKTLKALDDVETIAMATTERLRLGLDQFTGKKYGEALQWLKDEALVEPGRVHSGREATLERALSRRTRAAAAEGEEARALLMGAADAFDDLSSSLPEETVAKIIEDKLGPAKDPTPVWEGRYKEGQWREAVGPAGVKFKKFDPEVSKGVPELVDPQPSLLEAEPRPAAKPTDLTRPEGPPAVSSKVDEAPPRPSTLKDTAETAAPKFDEAGKLIDDADQLDFSLDAMEGGGQVGGAPARRGFEPTDLDAPGPWVKGKGEKVTHTPEEGLSGVYGVVGEQTQFLGPDGMPVEVKTPIEIRVMPDGETWAYRGKWEQRFDSVDQALASPKIKNALPVRADPGRFKQFADDMLARSDTMARARQMVDEPAPTPMGQLTDFEAAKTQPGSAAVDVTESVPAVAPERGPPPPRQMGLGEYQGQFASRAAGSGWRTMAENMPVDRTLARALRDMTPDEIRSEIGGMLRKQHINDMREAVLRNKDKLAQTVEMNPGLRRLDPLELGQHLPVELGKAIRGQLQIPESAGPIMVPRSYRNALKWRLNSMQIMFPSKKHPLVQWINGTKEHLTSLNPDSITNNLFANLLMLSTHHGKAPWTILSRGHQLLRNFERWQHGELMEPAAARLFNRFGKVVEKKGVLDATRVIDVELGEVGRKTVFDTIADGGGAVGGKIGKGVTAMRDFEVPLRPGAKPLSIARVNNAMRKGYRYGDNVLKMYEVFETRNRHRLRLDVLEDGHFYSIEGKRGKAQRIGRKGDDFVDDKGRVLNEAQLDDMLIDAGIQRAEGFFFNYRDTHWFIDMLRDTPLLAVASPFLTWHFKSLDIPLVKKGLAARTIEMPYGKTNSPIIASQMLAEAAEVGARRALAIQGVKGELFEDRNMFREMLSYYPEEAGARLFEVVSNPINGSQYIRSDPIHQYNWMEGADTLVRAVDSVLSNRGDISELKALWDEPPPTLVDQVKDDVEKHVHSIPGNPRWSEEDIRMWAKRAEAHWLRRNPREAKELKRRRRLLLKRAAGGFRVREALEFFGLGGNNVWRAIEDFRAGHLRNERLFHTLGHVATGGLYVSVGDMGLGAAESSMSRYRWSSAHPSEVEEGAIRYFFRSLLGVGHETVNIEGKVPAGMDWSDRQLDVAKHRRPVARYFKAVQQEIRDKFFKEIKDEIDTYTQYADGTESEELEQEMNNKASYYDKVKQIAKDEIDKRRLEYNAIRRVFRGPSVERLRREKAWRKQMLEQRKTVNE